MQKISFTLTEAAEATGLSRRLLTRCLQRGALVGHRVDRTVIVLHRNLVKFLREHAEPLAYKRTTARGRAVTVAPKRLIFTQGRRSRPPRPGEPHVVVVTKK